MRSHLLNYRGGDNAPWIFKNKIAAAAVQWELYAVRISVKIWRICEFRVIMGAGWIITSKPERTAPFALGCWTNNVLAARSLSPYHIMCKFMSALAIYIYVYIYIHMCVCMCALACRNVCPGDIYIYIYVYIYMCVCMCALACRNTTEIITIYHCSKKTHAK